MDEELSEYRLAQKRIVDAWKEVTNPAEQNLPTNFCYRGMFPAGHMQPSVMFTGGTLYFQLAMDIEEITDWTDEQIRDELRCRLYAAYNKLQGQLRTFLLRWDHESYRNENTTD